MGQCDAAARRPLPPVSVPEVPFRNVIRTLPARLSSRAASPRRGRTGPETCHSGTTSGRTVLGARQAAVVQQPLSQAPPSAAPHPCGVAPEPLPLPCPPGLALAVGMDPGAFAKHCRACGDSPRPARPCPRASDPCSPKGRHAGTHSRDTTASAQAAVVRPGAACLCSRGN